MYVLYENKDKELLKNLRLHRGYIYIGTLQKIPKIFLKEK